MEIMEVILYVQDMAAQVGFYQDILGLAILEPKDVKDFADVYWVEMDTGACRLALHGGGKRCLGEDAPKVVFRVADVPAARRRLLEQGVPMGEMRSPAPGVRVCDGRDPEGNRFSIEARWESLGPA
jgi:catechol 2,3-dioxygenase-like lactoylglutathione lyase family enzyme